MNSSLFRQSEGKRENSGYMPGYFSYSSHFLLPNMPQERYGPQVINEDATALTAELVSLGCGRGQARTQAQSSWVLRSPFSAGSWQGLAALALEDFAEAQTMFRAVYSNRA